MRTSKEILKDQNEAQAVLNKFLLKMSTGEREVWGELDKSVKDKYSSHKINGVTKVTILNITKDDIAKIEKAFSKAKKETEFKPTDKQMLENAVDTIARTAKELDEIDRPIYVKPAIQPPKKQTISSEIEMGDILDTLVKPSIAAKYNPAAPTQSSIAAQQAREKSKREAEKLAAESKAMQTPQPPLESVKAQERVGNARQAELTEAQKASRVSKLPETFRRDDLSTVVKQLNDRGFKGINDKQLRDLNNDEYNKIKKGLSESIFDGSKALKKVQGKKPSEKSKLNAKDLLKAIEQAEETLAQESELGSKPTASRVAWPDISAKKDAQTIVVKTTQLQQSQDKATTGSKQQPEPLFTRVPLSSLQDLRLMSSITSQHATGHPDKAATLASQSPNPVIPAFNTEAQTAFSGSDLDKTAATQAQAAVSKQAISAILIEPKNTREAVDLARSTKGQLPAARIDLATEIQSASITDALALATNIDSDTRVIPARSSFTGALVNTLSAEQGAEQALIPTLQEQATDLSQMALIAAAEQTIQTGLPQGVIVTSRIEGQNVHQTGSMSLNDFLNKLSPEQFEGLQRVIPQDLLAPASSSLIPLSAPVTGKERAIVLAKRMENVDPTQINMQALASIIALPEGIRLIGGAFDFKSDKVQLEISMDTDLLTKFSSATKRDLLDTPSLQSGDLASPPLARLDPPVSIDRTSEELARQAQQTALLKLAEKAEAERQEQLKKQTAEKQRLETERLAALAKQQPKGELKQEGDGDKGKQQQEPEQLKKQAAEKVEAERQEQLKKQPAEMTEAEKQAKLQQQQLEGGPKQDGDGDKDKQQQEQLQKQQQLQQLAAAEERRKAEALQQQQQVDVNAKGKANVGESFSQPGSLSVVEQTQQQLQQQKQQEQERQLAAEREQLAATKAAEEQERLKQQQQRSEEGVPTVVVQARREESSELKGGDMQESGNRDEGAQEQQLQPQSLLASQKRGSAVLTQSGIDQIGVELKGVGEMSGEETGEPEETSSKDLKDGDPLDSQGRTIRQRVQQQPTVVSQSLQQDEEEQASERPAKRTRRGSGQSSNEYTASDFRGETYTPQKVVGVTLLAMLGIMTLSMGFGIIPLLFFVCAGAMVNQMEKGAALKAKDANMDIQQGDKKAESSQSNDLMQQQMQNMMKFFERQSQAQDKRSEQQLQAQQQQFQQMMQVMGVVGPNGKSTKRGEESETGLSSGAVYTETPANAKMSMSKDAQKSVRDSGQSEELVEQKDLDQITQVLGSKLAPSGSSSAKSAAQRLGDSRQHVAANPQQRSS